MVVSHLIDKNISVIISDPWDFCDKNGTGPFYGSIMVIEEDALLIKFVRKIDFQGITFSQAVAQPRYEGIDLTNILNYPASVDLVPVSEKTILQPYMAEKHEYVVGSLFLFAASWRGWF